MEFYDVINKRRTHREWTDREVDFEAIKRIVDAGLAAPSCDHGKKWEFIVIKSREQKEKISGFAKVLADRFDTTKYENRKLTLGQKMYAYAVPRQFTMLVEAPYLIVPLFRTRGLKSEHVNQLNDFASIWCVVENMFLAATNEGLGCSMRIPVGKEADRALQDLNVPS